MVAMLVGRERDGWMVALLVGREIVRRLYGCDAGWARAGRLDGGAAYAHTFEAARFLPPRPNSNGNRRR